MEEKETQKKPPKYLVWNVEEMLHVCTPQDLAFIDNIIDRMLRYREEQGIESVKEFLVVNPNDPYYAEVLEVVKRYRGG